MSFQIAHGGREDLQAPEKEVLAQRGSIVTTEVEIERRRMLRSVMRSSSGISKGTPLSRTLLHIRVGDIYSLLIESIQ